MLRKLILFVILLVTSIVFVSSCASEEDEAELQTDPEEETEYSAKINGVLIPDKNLKEAIIDELEIDYTTKDDLKKLKSLSVEYENISNLEGLQYAENLEELDLPRSTTLDYSPLEGHKNLVLSIPSEQLPEDLSSFQDIKKLILYTEDPDYAKNPENINVLKELKNIELQIDIHEPFAGLIDNIIWSNDGIYVAYRHQVPEYRGLTLDIYIIDTKEDEGKVVYSVREALIEFAGMSSDKNPLNQWVEGTEDYPRYEKHEWTDDGDALLITIGDGSDIYGDLAEDELESGVYKYNLAKEKITSFTAHFPEDNYED